MSSSDTHPTPIAAETIDGLRRRINRLTLENRSLKTHYESARDRVFELEVDVAELQDRPVETSTISAESQIAAEVAVLNAELAAKDAEIAQLKGDYAQLKDATLTYFTDLFRSMRQRLPRISAVIRADFASFKNEVLDDLETELADLGAEEQFTSLEASSMHDTSQYKSPPPSHVEPDSLEQIHTSPSRPSELRSKQVTTDSSHQFGPQSTITQSPDSQFRKTNDSVQSQIKGKLGVQRLSNTEERIQMSSRDDEIVAYSERTLSSEGELMAKGPGIAASYNIDHIRNPRVTIPCKLQVNDGPIIGSFFQQRSGICSKLYLDGGVHGSPSIRLSFMHPGSDTGAVKLGEIGWLVDDHVKGKWVVKQLDAGRVAETNEGKSDIRNPKAIEALSPQDYNDLHCITLDLNPHLYGFVRKDYYQKTGSQNLIEFLRIMFDIQKEYQVKIWFLAPIPQSSYPVSFKDACLAPIKGTFQQRQPPLSRSRDTYGQCILDLPDKRPLSVAAKLPTKAKRSNRTLHGFRNH